MFEGLGSILCKFLIIDLNPDGSMRTNDRTFSTLDTGYLIPYRDLESNIPLFIPRGVARVGPVNREGTYGQVVSITGNDLSEYILHEIGGILGHRWAHG